MQEVVLNVVELDACPHSIPPTRVCPHQQQVVAIATGSKLGPHLESQKNVCQSEYIFTQVPTVECYLHHIYEEVLDRRTLFRRVF